MKLVYKPWGSDPVDNPKGFPADYPRDSMRIEDGVRVPEGYVEISQSEYKARVESGYAEVAAINAKTESDSKESERTELDAIRRLFDEGDAIVDTFDTATNQQKFRLCLIVFKLLRPQKRQILDQYKPE